MPVIPTPTPVPSARSRRILYAEDVKELREVARMIVAPMGHSFECVENGLLAFNRVQAAPDEFDLVITDHHMPLMSGLELVMQLRTLPFRGKILVFSSDLHPGTAAMYQQLNVDRILNKPVSPQVLRRVLAELFEPVASDVAPLTGVAGPAK